MIGLPAFASSSSGSAIPDPRSFAIASPYAILYGSATVLKKWNLEDISISDNTMELPITQEETMKISSQLVSLEIKMVANGDIEFFETITLKVKSRRDRHIFEVTGG